MIQEVAPSHLILFFMQRKLKLLYIFFYIGYSIVHGCDQINKGKTNYIRIRFL